VHDTFALVMAAWRGDGGGVFPGGRVRRGRGPQAGRDVVGGRRWKSKTSTVLKKKRTVGGEWIQDQVRGKEGKGGGRDSGEVGRRGWRRAVYGLALMVVGQGHLEWPGAPEAVWREVTTQMVQAP